MLKKEKIDGYQCAIKYTDVDLIQTKDELIIHIPYKDREEIIRAKDIEVEKYRAAAAEAIEQNKILEESANRTIKMYKEGYDNATAQIEELKEQLEKAQHEEIDNWTDIIIHKQAIPAELWGNKKFMDLYDMPTYSELTKLSKTIRTFAEEQYFKAEQKLEDIATEMVNATVNKNYNKGMKLQNELVKQKTIIAIMEDILSIYNLNKKA